MRGRTYSLLYHGTVVSKVEKKDNLLLYDSQIAHGAYLRKILKLNRAYNIVSRDIDKIEDVDGYLDANEITIAILFVDSKEKLYELLPFLNREIHLVLCTPSTEIRWLQSTFPNMLMLDIGVPKKELFDQVKLALSRLE